MVDTPTCGGTIFMGKYIRNVRLATIAKIIIPLFLICVVLIFVSFIIYHSAIDEEYRILNDLMVHYSILVDGDLSQMLNRAQNQANFAFCLHIWVIGTSVGLALFSLFFVAIKLSPIRNVVETATSLASGDIEENTTEIANDELGQLTIELAYKIQEIENNVSVLEDVLEKANAANRAKSYFLSNMSHEIRTPINAIVGMTAIAKNTHSVERKDYALGKIGDASNHLLGIISNILDMAKIEANKLELHPVTFAFDELLKTVVTINSFRIAEKHQSLSVDIDEKIPYMLHCDDQRLTQVITNLISNAAKFTPIQGKINLSAQLLNIDNSTCVIEFKIQDNGVGISDELQARLFEPFEQAENSTTRTYGGTGLGLPITKRIVELMGGEIAVQSILGEGSTFSFTIKAEKVDDDNESKHVLTKSLGENIDQFEGYRALLVEDVDINREIVMSFLEPTKLDIDYAVNGVEAVSMFRENPDKYNIIFMDLQMPEMDGYDATRAIRALAHNKAKTIPIIAMTANVFKADVDACLAAGMNDHLGKPLNYEVVLGVLRYYLLKQPPTTDRRKTDRRKSKVDRRQGMDRRKGDRRQQQH